MRDISRRKLIVCAMAASSMGPAVDAFRRGQLFVGKRIRSANFSPSEKHLLVSLVQKHVQTVESKNGGAVSHAEKALCWERIAAEFRLLSPGLCRSSSSLRKLWENLKKSARNVAAARDHTDGFVENPLLLLVGSLVGITGLKNLNHEDNYADCAEFGGGSTNQDGIKDMQDIVVVEEDKIEIGKLIKEISPVEFSPTQAPRGHSPLFITLPPIPPAPVQHLDTSATHSEAVASTPALSVHSEEAVPVEPAACTTQSAQENTTLPTQQIANTSERLLLRHRQNNSGKQQNSRFLKAANRNSLYMERLRLVKQETQCAIQEEKRKEELHVLHVAKLKEEMQWKRELHKEQLREMRLNNRLLIQKLRALKAQT